MALMKSALKGFGRKTNLVEALTAPNAEEEVKVKNIVVDTSELKTAEKTIKVKAISPKVIKKQKDVDSESSLTSRITEDFDRAIAFYCVENSIKKIDLVNASVAAVVGYDCEPSTLRGDNCKIIIPASAKTKFIAIKISNELKKTVKRYVLNMKQTDSDFNEGFLVSQAVADMIGYKKKLRFD